MKLQKMKIYGFRSIKEEITLLFDEKTTILIGANDHGKSNILESILRLNDKNPIKAEDRNWDLQDDEKTRIEWYFNISDDDKKQIESKIAEELEKSTTVNPAGEPQEIKVEEINSTGSTQNEVQVAETATTNTEKTSILETEENCLNSNSDNQIVYFREDIGSPVKVLSVPFKVLKTNENILLDLRPKIEPFFTPITTNLKDDITYEELADPKYEFMQGIFYLAGLWEYKESIFQQNPQTSKILSDASERLKKMLNDRWNQGKDLDWRLVHGGNNGDHILIQIYDPAVRNQYTQPSQRSSGFQTFFILSMIITARKYNNPSNSYIFLFDEPGTYLHPAAQIDLQRSFEVTANEAQIAYSTHSIFLINKNYPERNRVVSKGIQGTKIDQKPFQKNWKAVRESLGILLHNNFLLAESTLLVEGPSDVIYFLSALQQAKKGDIDIDLNEFSIMDAGSSENYQAMTKICLEEGRKIVALLDGDSAGKKIKSNLEKICAEEIDKKALQIYMLPENESIEDVFCEISCLHDSIENLFNQLVDQNIRAKAENINEKEIIGGIKKNKTHTLGWTIMEKTQQLFNPQESLSKLSIALKYEENSKNKELKLDKRATSILSDLIKMIGVKGEKSTEKGVYEELKD